MNGCHGLIGFQSIRLIYQRLVGNLEKRHFGRGESGGETGDKALGSVDTGMIGPNPPGFCIGGFFCGLEVLLGSIGMSFFCRLDFCFN